MPLSRAQMPQISFLAPEDTQLYPRTQKSQKTPFKRVSAYAPLSPGISIRAYAHIRTHVYIIICPCMHLSPHLCICIYPCSYMQLCAAISICVCPGTDTHIHRSGHMQGWGYVHIHVQGYGWVYMGICRYVYVQVQTDRQTDSFPVVCTRSPLEGEAKRGWLPGTIKRLFNRLNVCAYLCV